MPDTFLLITNAAMSPRTPGAIRDARLILEVLQATSRWSGDAERPAVSKPIRELIWFVWEQPRLRRYAEANGLRLIASKYPSWVPWSSGARAVLKGRRSGHLVLEHLTPTRVIVQDLLARPPETPAALIKVLNQRLAHTVLSSDENRLITAAGYASKLVEGDPDPLARYRAAKLRLNHFKPIENT